MNRYDWILVGMCLYGVYLMINGVLGVVTVVVSPSFGEIGMIGGLDLNLAGLSGIKTAGIIIAIAKSFLGSFLVWVSMRLGSAISKKALDKVPG